MVANRVAASIPAKLAAVADVALDKLGEMVERSEDPEFILDAADKALHRMGYAPQSSRNPAGSPSTFGSPLVQQNLFIGAGDLADARELMRLTSSAGTADLPQGRVCDAYAYASAATLQGDSFPDPNEKVISDSSAGPR
jgi:hypothetical protein